jgi:hypothetical protein
MRSKFGVSVVLAAAVLLALGPSLAAADGKGKRTLRLVAVENQSEFLDLGTSGPSLGDELAFSEILKQRGREVGDSAVTCTVTEAVPPYDVLVFQCLGTLSLRHRGQITLQGRIEVQGEDDPGPFEVAITGGTREFSGASGRAIVRDVSPTRTVYRLQFDAGKKHRH